jgi:hypothetical protein
MAKPLRGRGQEPKTDGAGDSGDGLYDDRVLEVTGTGDGDDDNSRPVMEHSTPASFPNKHLVFLDREFQVPGVDFEVINAPDDDIKWIHSRFKPHRILTVIDLSTGDVFWRWNPITGDLT